MAKAKSSEVKYILTTYKSDVNARQKAEYATLQEAQEAMRSDYEQELQYCIERGESPQLAYIGAKEAYIKGAHKCQWYIKQS